MSANKIAVEGVVVRGHRFASNIDGTSPFGASTIALQAPIFRERGLDISNMYMGTLNISIAPKTRMIIMTKPTITNVTWHPEYPAENFFLSRCKLTFEAKEFYGWVYYPDPSTKIAHFQHDSLFELLMPNIPGIVYGSSVALLVNVDEVRIQ